MPCADDLSVLPRAITDELVPCWHVAGDGSSCAADGDAYKILAISQPVSGIAVLNSNHTITYTPNASFSGRDPFTYTISDGRGGTATGQVVVTVRR